MKLAEQPTLVEAATYRAACRWRDGHCNNNEADFYRAGDLLNAVSEDDREAAKRAAKARHRFGYVGSAIGFVVASGSRPVERVLPDGSVGMDYEDSPAAWGEPIMVRLFLTGAHDNSPVEGAYILWPGKDQSDPPAVQELFGGNGHSDGQEAYPVAWAEHNRRAAGKQRSGRAVKRPA